MFQPPRGTRDFLPEEMLRRNHIFETLRRVFESFGYSPLETPAFESWELFSKKGGGGEDVKKEIYYFKDKSDRELGLRFDLTVPLARIAASKPELPKPFKRYQIGRVWRYEEVKSGRRYREFWQADADTVGSDSMQADAEALAIGVAGLKALGFKRFCIKLNSRKVLEGLAELAKIPKGKFLSTFRALDKAEKFGLKTVKNELKTLGIKPESIKELLSLISVKGSNETVLKKLKTLLPDKKPAKELEEIIKYSKAYNISNFIKIDLSLARGLDYYTGPIYEIVITGREAFGSVFGGGRYDKLIELYGGKPTPATGMSFGIERLYEIMLKDMMFKTPKTKTKVFVVAVTDKVMEKAARVARDLRERGINTETDLMNRNLKKQLSYINRAGIPYTLFVGERELKARKFTLRDMKTGKERKLGLEGIVKRLG